MFKLIRGIQSKNDCRDPNRKNRYRLGLGLKKGIVSEFYLEIKKSDNNNTINDSVHLTWEDKRPHTCNDDESPTRFLNIVKMYTDDNWDTHFSDTQPKPCNITFQDDNNVVRKITFQELDVSIVSMQRTRTDSYEHKSILGNIQTLISGKENDENKLYWEYVFHTKMNNLEQLNFGDIAKEKNKTKIRRRDLVRKHWGGMKKTKKSNRKNTKTSKRRQRKKTQKGNTPTLTK